MFGRDNSPPNPWWKILDPHKWQQYGEVDMIKRLDSLQLPFLNICPAICRLIFHNNNHSNNNNNTNSDSNIYIYIYIYINIYIYYIYIICWIGSIPISLWLLHGSTIAENHIFSVAYRTHGQPALSRPLVFLFSSSLRLRANDPQHFSVYQYKTMW